MKTALLLACAIGLAFAEQDLRPDLALTLSTDRQSYAPGDTFVLALQAGIPDGFHFYSNPLGPGIGLPTTISVRQSPSLRWLDLAKSPPRKYQPQAGAWVWAHEKQVRFFLRGVVDPAAHGTVSDTIMIDGLMCKASCIKLTRSVPFALTVGTRDTLAPFAAAPHLAALLVAARPMPLDTGAEDVPDEEDAAGDETIPEWDFEPVSGRARLGLGLALVLAFLAGIILNVMPCVLPVLGIKVLTLSQGHQNRRQALLSSLAFAAGMIVVFMALASLAAFAGFSWGQQFQKPAFLVGIVCFMFFFALGMFDMYLLLVPPSVGTAERRARQGLAGDFVRGVFATVLATPCSGPLLGATLAWALTQPPLAIYAVFLSLGAGMASK